MNAAQVYKADSRILTKLAETEDPAESLWQTEELAAIWQHQLAAPLEFDLSTQGPKAKHVLETTLTSVPSAPRTFDSLLHDIHPPIKLLVLAKDFGKHNATSKNAALPQKIARLLYVASIIAALVRCKKRISKLSDDELMQGLKLCLSWPWIDASTRLLLQEGLERLQFPRITGATNDPTV